MPILTVDGEQLVDSSGTCLWMIMGLFILVEFHFKCPLNWYVTCLQLLLTSWAVRFFQEEKLIQTWMMMIMKRKSGVGKFFFFFTSLFSWSIIIFFPWPSICSWSKYFYVLPEVTLVNSILWEIWDFYNKLHLLVSKQSFIQGITSLCRKGLFSCFRDHKNVSFARISTHILSCVCLHVLTNIYIHTHIHLYIHTHIYIVIYNKKVEYLDWKHSKMMLSSSSSSSCPDLSFLSFYLCCVAKLCFIRHSIINIYICDHVLAGITIATMAFDKSGVLIFMASWYRWVDNHLVHILSPNIYRNTSEALESFDYITNNGKTCARCIII